MPRSVSKLHLAVIAASIPGAALWIEQGHRIDIEPPAGAAFRASIAEVCPDNENVPYSAECIVFMQGEVASVSLRIRTPTILPEASGRRELFGPACPPSNENVPYSSRCLKFMSGWFWLANQMESAP